MKKLLDIFKSAGSEKKNIQDISKITRYSQNSNVSSKSNEKSIENNFILPIEILSLIFQNFETPRELFQLAKVCRLFYQVFNLNVIWAHLFELHVPEYNYQEELKNCPYISLKMKFKELFHAFKWDRKDGNANHLIFYSDYKIQRNGTNGCFPIARATYPIKLGSFKVKIVSRDGENYAGIGLTTLESFQDLSGHTKIIGTNSNSFGYITDYVNKTYYLFFESQKLFDDVERYDVGDIVGFQLERTHDPNFLELTFFKNKTVQGRSKLIPSNLVYYPAVSFSTNLCVEILSINYNS